MAHHEQFDMPPPRRYHNHGVLRFMPEHYFARQIEVTTGGEVKAPVSFRLDGREYAIAEVLESWPDYGFSRGETSKTWRTRHHRNYYRVKTSDGAVYEMYYDRGTNLKHPEFRKWFLTQQL
ncbi:MAG: DUF6504 family protein [Dehalococcoidales bacterium]|jgi:hypothetical protein